MNIQVILHQIAVLFVLIAVGFLFGKFKVLTQDGNKALSKFVLFIALPCTVLNSVFEIEADITISSTLYFMLMSLLSIVIAFAIAVPLILLLSGKKGDRGLLSFMSVFSNSGFMGFPVVIALFGSASAFYVALFNIPFNAIVFSLGIFMIAGKGGRFDPKILLNPTLITCILSVAIALTGPQIPFVITEAIRITGNITTPGAMIVIGASLAFIPLKSVFSDWRIAPVTLIKLIIVPVITWLILKQFITDEFILGVLVVIACMPTAAMSAMLALEYGGNERTASAGIFTTTLLSAISVPLIVYYLLM